MIFSSFCNAAYLTDDSSADEMVKHSPSMAGTLDSVTQGASLFLDPTGAQVGEHVQGEEGIAYADLDLNACVEPKQFHDVVGGYQRFDVFDLRVNRSRQGPESTFQAKLEVETMPKMAAHESSEQNSISNERLNRRHGMGGLRVI